MPACPYRKLGCGGCSPLRASYKEQIWKKQDMVKTLFPSAEKMLPSPSELHYRNKGIATFCMKDGALACGLYKRGTHQVLPLPEGCMIENEEIAHIQREAVRALSGLPVYNEDARTGLLRHIVTRFFPSTGQAMVTIVTGGADFPDGKTRAESIVKACPSVRCVIQNRNPRASSAVLGYDERVLYGSGYVEDELCGLRLRISSRAFYQINSLQAANLYTLALSMAELDDTDTVLDAYCGVGAIGMLAARTAGRAVGIEIGEQAVRDARDNAARNGLHNISFIKGDAEKILPELSENFTAAFIDPPRDGCSRPFLCALAARAPKRIVYISCDTSTQRRDVSILEARGYSLVRVKPVDMFPQTPHIENVVLLSKHQSEAKPEP